LRKPKGLVGLLMNLKKERRLNVSNRKPAEYKVTVIEGDLNARISKYPAMFT